MRCCSVLTSVEIGSDHRPRLLELENCVAPRWQRKKKRCSKNWKPEWGGALYWAQHDHGVATYPASFNTLSLFSVTTRSAHFVTTVSPHHKGQRLTFNGWWQSAWQPSLEDNLESDLTDEATRRALTHTQLQAITDLLNDPWQNMPAERRDALQAIQKQTMSEFFPGGSRAGIEA